LKTASAVKMQFQSGAVLRMTDGEKGGALLKYSAHLRAAAVPEVDAKAISLATWITTEDAHIWGIMGITDPSADRRVKTADVLGFEVTFACGTRQAMHDLCDQTKKPCTNDFTLPEGSKAFRDCVRDGKASNAILNLRPKKDGGGDEVVRAPFSADEVVVRAYFTELPTKCIKEQKYLPTTEKDEKGKARNGWDVYTNFKDIIADCVDIKEGDAPESLKAPIDEHYKGMLLGNGLPQETLKEVLIDPADFLDEVDLF